MMSSTMQPLKKLKMHAYKYIQKYILLNTSLLYIYSIGINHLILILVDSDYDS